MAWSQNCIYAFFTFFIKQVKGLIEAKGGFSIMVIMYVLLKLGFKDNTTPWFYPFYGIKTLCIWGRWWWYFILWYYRSGVQSQNFSDIMMWYKFLGRGGPMKQIHIWKRGHWKLFSLMWGGRWKFFHVFCDLLHTPPADTFWTLPYLFHCIPYL